MMGIPLVLAASLATAVFAPAAARADEPAWVAAPAPAGAGAARAPAAVVDREFARISRGWKPTQRGRTTLYCRQETSLGTRVGRNVCLTRQQLYDRAKAGQEARDRMAKPNQCTGPCTIGG